MSDEDELRRMREEVETLTRRVERLAAGRAQAQIDRDSARDEATALRAKVERVRRTLTENVEAIYTNDEGGDDTYVPTWAIEAALDGDA